MNKGQREIFRNLDTESLSDIKFLRKSIKQIRGGREKIRHLFYDSFLTDEWICTSDLTIITGFRLFTIYNSVISLQVSKEITGKSITKVEYYEQFRDRKDRAANLLLDIAKVRLECPEDEVSLAAMTLPDMEITSLEGTPRTIQSSGYYFKKYVNPGDKIDGVEPLDGQLIDL